MHDEEVDERVIEQSIVHNVKNFIMTFGIGFTFIGNQVHFDKLGHDHWMDFFRQPMGVATCKTADEVDPELVKLLPPKEELVKLHDTGEDEEK